VTDKVKKGGLMRCCLRTLAEYYRDGPASKAAEGQVMPCAFCSGIMVFRGGYWEWDHA
jgi:hypothetical protein